MKQFFLVFPSLLLVGFLAACDQGSGSGEPEGSTDSATADLLSFEFLIDSLHYRNAALTDLGRQAYKPLDTAVFRIDTLPGSQGWESVFVRVKGEPKSFEAYVRYDGFLACGVDVVSGRALYRYDSETSQGEEFTAVCADTALAYPIPFKRRYDLNYYAGKGIRLDVQTFGYVGRGEIQVYVRY